MQVNGLVVMDVFFRRGRKRLAPASPDVAETVLERPTKRTKRGAVKNTPVKSPKKAAASPKVTEKATEVSSKKTRRGAVKKSPVKTAAKASRYALDLTRQHYIDVCYLTDKQLLVIVRFYHYIECDTTFIHWRLNFQTVSLLSVYIDI